MTPERLKQIQEFYLSARDCDPGIRPEFLAQACGGDEELRREVESLLAQGSGEVMGRPAIEVAAELLASGNVGPGAQVGPYRIESQLGAGGMGEVFRAVDTRLGRNVAIKTCREQFSDRFHREARAVSSLNHPHICTLYDVGPNYLVMELIERAKRLRIASSAGSYRLRRRFVRLANRRRAGSGACPENHSS
jgi:serine/threonine protein kinase